MNPGVIVLAILCIWPANATDLPKIAAAQAPSMEVCQSGVAAMKAKLEADPLVRFVGTQCVVLHKGDKA